MTYQITNEAIADYRKHLRGEEYSEGTVQKYLRDIRTFATWLKGHGTDHAEEIRPDADENRGIEDERKAAESGEKREPPFLWEGRARIVSCLPIGACHRQSFFPTWIRWRLEIFSF